MSEILTQNESSVKSVKPFARQGHYTVIDNFILDHIMPVLAPNAWKVLCFIIRKTVGWHKDEDKLSLGQIMAGTGIKNRNTVSNAISQLEQGNYILVHRPADQKTPNTYSLNSDYELVQKSYQADSEASTKIVPELVRKSYPQNKDSKHINNIAGKPARKPKLPKTKPKEPGPKTILMGEFIIVTGLSIPKNKSDQGFWWGRIGAINDLVNGDSEKGKRLIREAVEKLRKEELPISSPGSLYKTITALLEKESRKPKPQIDNGQYVEVKPEETNGKGEMAVSEDWLTEQFNQARGGA
jgi:hypothetical protein